MRRRQSHGPGSSGNPCYRNSAWIPKARIGNRILSGRFSRVFGFIGGPAERTGDDLEALGSRRMVIPLREYLGHVRETQFVADVI